MSPDILHSTFRIIFFVPRACAARATACVLRYSGHNIRTCGGNSPEADGCTLTSSPLCSCEKSLNEPLKTYILLPMVIPISLFSILYRPGLFDHIIQPPSAVIVIRTSHPMPLAVDHDLGHPAEAVDGLRSAHILGRASALIRHLAV